MKSKLKDLLVSLSTLLHGTLQEKLMWTFRLYDLDGDGVITKVELGNVVVGIYELMGIILLPQVTSPHSYQTLQSYYFRLAHFLVLITYQGEENLSL